MNQRFVPLTTSIIFNETQIVICYILDFVIIVLIILHCTAFYGYHIDSTKQKVTDFFTENVFFAFFYKYIIYFTITVSLNNIP
jgi:hypothetical protein